MKTRLTDLIAVPAPVAARVRREARKRGMKMYALAGALIERGLGCEISAGGHNSNNVCQSVMPQKTNQRPPADQQQ